MSDIKITKEIFCKCLEILGCKQSSLNENIYANYKHMFIYFPTMFVVDKNFDVTHDYRIITEESGPKYTEQYIAEIYDTISFKPSFNFVPNEQGPSNG
jgi:hypothetical protein